MLLTEATPQGATPQSLRHNINRKVSQCIYTHIHTHIYIHIYHIHIRCIKIPVITSSDAMKSASHNNTCHAHTYIRVYHTHMWCIKIPVITSSDAMKSASPNNTCHTHIYIPVYHTLVRCIKTPLVTSLVIIVKCYERSFDTPYRNMLREVFRNISCDSCYFVTQT